MSLEKSGIDLGSDLAGETGGYFQHNHAFKISDNIA